MKHVNGKIVFKTEKDAALGGVGTNFFKITLAEIENNNFYAEIKFTFLKKKGGLYTNNLRVAGRLVPSKKTDSYILRLQQLDWQNGDKQLADLICFSIDENSLHFFALHPGVAMSALAFEVLTLESRRVKLRATAKPTYEEAAVKELFPKPKKSFTTLAKPTPAKLPVKKKKSKAAKLISKIKRRLKKILKK